MADDCHCRAPSARTTVRLPRFDGSPGVLLSEVLDGVGTHLVVENLFSLDPTASLLCVSFVERRGAEHMAVRCVLHLDGDAARVSLRYDPEPLERWGLNFAGRIVVEHESAGDGSESREVLLLGERSYDPAGLTGDAHASERVGGNCQCTLTALLVAQLTALSHGASVADVKRLHQAALPLVTELHGRTTLFAWNLHQALAAVVRRQPQLSYPEYIWRCSRMGRIDLSLEERAHTRAYLLSWRRGVPTPPMQYLTKIAEKDNRDGQLETEMGATRYRALQRRLRALIRTRAPLVTFAEDGQPVAVSRAQWRARAREALDGGAWRLATAADTEGAVGPARTVKVAVLPSAEAFREALEGPPAVVIDGAGITVSLVSPGAAVDGTIVASGSAAGATGLVLVVGDSCELEDGQQSFEGSASEALVVMVAHIVTQTSRRVFFEASALGQADVVESLLATGLPPSCIDAEGVALAQLEQLVKAKGVKWKTELVELRLAHGQTALHYAAGGGHLAVVELLLRAGADPAIRNSHGRTPLHMAAGFGREAVVRVLCQTCPLPRVSGTAEEDEGKLAADDDDVVNLGELDLFSQDDDPEHQLPQPTANLLDAQDNHGQTALHTVFVAVGQLSQTLGPKFAWGPRLACARVMLESGVDALLRDKFGRRATEYVQLRSTRWRTAQHRLLGRLLVSAAGDPVRETLHVAGEFLHISAQMHDRREAYLALSDEFTTLALQLCKSDTYIPTQFSAETRELARQRFGRDAAVFLALSYQGWDGSCATDIALTTNNTTFITDPSVVRVLGSFWSGEYQHISFAKRFAEPRLMLTWPALSFAIEAMGYVALACVFVAVLVQPVATDDGYTVLSQPLRALDVAWVVFAVSHVHQEVLELLSVGLSSYFGHGWNVIDFGIMLAMLVVVGQRLSGALLEPAEDAVSMLVYQISAGALVICVSYRLLFVLTIHATLGPLLRMIGKMVTDLRDFAVIGAAVLVSFAVAMWVLLQWRDDADAVGLGSFSDVLLLMYELFLGAIDYRKYDVLTGERYVAAVALQSAVLAITNILLLNLLIAMLGTRYSEVQERNHSEYVVGRSRLIWQHDQYRTTLPMPLNLVASLLLVAWRALRTFAAVLPVDASSEAPDWVCAYCLTQRAPAEAEACLLCGRLRSALTARQYRRARVSLLVYTVFLWLPAAVVLIPGAAAVRRARAWLRPLRLRAHAFWVERLRERTAVTVGARRARGAERTPQERLEQAQLARLVNEMFGSISGPAPGQVPAVPAVPKGPRLAAVLRRAAGGAEG